MSEPDQRLCLYGIKACDTMKRPVPGSTNMGRTTSSTTTRAPGSTAPTEAWCNEHGWQTVLNRAGTTFRKLDDAAKADLDQARAIELMLAQPSMIKRPVLDGRQNPDWLQARSLRCRTGSAELTAARRTAHRKRIIPCLQPLQPRLWRWHPEPPGRLAGSLLRSRCCNRPASWSTPSPRCSATPAAAIAITTTQAAQLADALKPLDTAQHALLTRLAESQRPLVVTPGRRRSPAGRRRSLTSTPEAYPSCT